MERLGNLEKSLISKYFFNYTEKTTKLHWSLALWVALVLELLTLLLLEDTMLSSMDLLLNKKSKRLSVNFKLSILILNLSIFLLIWLKLLTARRSLMKLLKNSEESMFWSTMPVFNILTNASISLTLNGSKLLHLTSVQLSIFQSTLFHTCKKQDGEESLTLHQFTD